MGETVTAESLDVERVRWRGALPPTSAPTSSEAPPRHGPGERFLKGPVPWKWLEGAAQQPGRALHVAVAIWQLAGMRRSRCVALNLSRLGSLGVTRYAASRGLKALEAVGLVQVNRQRGRKAVVTILDHQREAG